MISEIEYDRMQEEQAIAGIISRCAKAIFDAHGAETMEQLQRNLYKYIDCGPAISFELNEAACEYAHDCLEAEIGLEPIRVNRFVYVGDPRARTIVYPWLSICKIGVSSIVEGSDAEVPVQWLDLEQFADPDGPYEGDLPELGKAAVDAFSKIVNEVNQEACALWNEANPDWDSETEDGKPYE